MRAPQFRMAAALAAIALLLLPAALPAALPTARFSVRAQASAAPQSVETLKPQDLLPFDGAIRRAKLPNGLTYLLRRNNRPEKRVSLRLAVRAGSIEEAGDQQGLAHLIEHMAFKGSQHFKPGEALLYFESAGARLGPHVNAVTRFDETVYMLDLPTDKPEVIESGLTALADFGGGLTFDPVELDKERNVVIEEWRSGLGAGSRVRDKQLPVLLNRSRYADRLPIGKPEVIRSASADQLRAFYDTWYRPERMALIGVGDIDLDQIERAIASIFTPMRARGVAAPEPDRRVPLGQELLVSVVTDPEVTQSSVQIVRKRPRDAEVRVADYRRQIVVRLVEHMFDARLAELARKPEAKFLGAMVADQPLTPEVTMLGTGAGVRDGQLEDGVRALAVETTRARELGFTPSELDRAKKWLAAMYERAYAERDKPESSVLAAELLRHFLVDEPVPGIEYEYRLVQQALSDVTATEATAAARALFANDSRIVLALSPQKDGVHIPSEADLRSALIEAEHTAVTAWSDTTVSRALVDPKPRPGGIASRREIENLGVTVVRFANGLEAWLKPTDFKNDQVLFAMEASGGTSLAPPAAFLEASLASDYVMASGAGGLTAVDLHKLLAGKQVSVRPFASLSTHGIAGSATPADLETALQLVYQTFRAPGDDPEALALMKRRLEAAVANRGQDPQQVFRERLNQVNSSGHYTTVPPTLERITTLDRERMAGFYRQRFSNAADFALVMVGAFKMDEAIPLIAQYLGSLPSTGTRTSRFSELGIRFPASPQRVLVEKGKEPRSEAVISFFAEPSPDPVERENLAEATIVLESALRIMLRETLGQTYTVSVRLEPRLPQRGAGHVAVSFGTAPENIDAMTERVLQEVRRLQRDGPSADLTDRAKQLARRNDETALKQNAHWLRELVSVHVLGGDPAEILRRAHRIDGVTPPVLQQAFQRYFPLDRFTVVTLAPTPTHQPESIERSRLNLDVVAARLIPSDQRPDLINAERPRVSHGR